MFMFYKKQSCCLSIIDGHGFFYSCDVTTTFIFIFFLLETLKHSVVADNRNA